MTIRSNGSYRFIVLCLIFACFSSLIRSSPIQQVEQLVLTQSQSSRVPTHLEDVSVTELLIGLDNHDYTSEQLVEAYLERISVFSDIRTILDVNPHALKQARASDKLRRTLEKGKVLPLLGIPFIVKGNIAIPSSAGPTTAGSYALLNSTVIKASPVVEKLLIAGAVLLATSNLDEFAEAKGDASWGFSARGKQMKSIYGKSTTTNLDLALDHGYGEICGSSGGSALSVALGLGAFALGTQTGVSIVCPAGRASLVGFKPGAGGMTSMKGTIPISKHLDVIGPMTRTVADAALVWSVIKHPKGWTDEDEDEEKVEVKEEGEILPIVRLNHSKIRVGIPRKVFWDELDDMPHCILAMETFLRHLAQDNRFEIIDKEVVNITSMNLDSRKFLGIITTHELKLGINHYLNTWVTSTSPIKSLTDIIEFNLANPELELPPGPHSHFNHSPSPDESYSDQSNLIKSDSIQVIGWLNSSYVEAKLEVERIGWRDGFQKYFQGEGGEGVDIMIIPTEGVSGTMASLARVPQITIPLSYYPTSYSIDPNATWPLYPYPSMPFGLSILAPRGHEHHENLLKIAQVVEEIIFDYSGKSLGNRKDWMREDVRDRLENLNKGGS